MSASRQVLLRLFAEASPARSADLAAALVRCLAEYGTVEVRELGTYWKIPQYLEFDAEIAANDTASRCVGHLQVLEPTGWTGDVWNHQPDGPPFLIPEIRWAWITAAED